MILLLLLLFIHKPLYQFFKQITEHDDNDRPGKQIRRVQIDLGVVEPLADGAARQTDDLRRHARLPAQAQTGRAGGTEEGLKLLLSDKDCDMHYAVGSLYLVGEIKALY